MIFKKFKIDVSNNYNIFQKLIMKLENQPNEKNLVLYVFVKITDQFNDDWINKTKINKKNHNKCQQKKTLLKQKIQNSNNFQNIIW